MHSSCTPYNHPAAAPAALAGCGCLPGGDCLPGSALAAPWQQGLSRAASHIPKARTGTTARLPSPTKTPAHKAPREADARLLRPALPAQWLLLRQAEQIINNDLTRGRTRIPPKRRLTPQPANAPGSSTAGQRTTAGAQSAQARPEPGACSLLAGGPWVSRPQTSGGLDLGDQDVRPDAEEGTSPHPAPAGPNPPTAAAAPAVLAGLPGWPRLPSSALVAGSRSELRKASASTPGGLPRHAPAPLIPLPSPETTAARRAPRGHAAQTLRPALQQAAARV